MIANAAGVCLFCRRRPAGSNEHIIPEEISKRILEISPLTPEHGGPVVPKPGATRFHYNKLIDMTVNVVCGNCNHKFFNDLQVAARPFFWPAIAGEPVLVSTELKKALAAWAYKTALLIPLNLEPRPKWPTIVGSLCSEFYEVSRPPAGARVWAGRYDLREEFPELVARADLSELNVRRRSVEYRGTHVVFTLGFLVIAVMFWPQGIPDEIPREAERYPESQFLAMWPALLGDSSWPPAETFGYEALGALSTWGP